MPKHDIIIIGAGPAGLPTALHFAQDFPHFATRVLILDKARHPRPKLCTDVEIILPRLGLDGLPCIFPHSKSLLSVLYSS